MDLIVRARGAPAMEKLALGNRKSPVDYGVLGWQKTGGVGAPGLAGPGRLCAFCRLYPISGEISRLGFCLLGNSRR